MSIVYKLSDGTEYEREKVISWADIEQDEFGNIITDGDGYIVDKDEHPIYYGSNIRMWYRDELDEGWSRYYLRISPQYIHEDGEPLVYYIDDEGEVTSRIVQSIVVKIKPGHIRLTDSKSVIAWGAQLESIQPYDDVLLPYQPTNKQNYVGVYDFIPDIDIRTPITLESEGSKAQLVKYYDSELQPQQYEDNSSPLTAQLYFYIRDPFEEELFKPKELLSYIPGTLYIGFLDWGDGSPMEYDKEPKRLTESSVIKHEYKESGIFEITGEMFNVARDENGESLGIGYFKEFLIRINVNINLDDEGSVQRLGSRSSHRFIPYNETAPVVSGVSKSSLYYKLLKRKLGYVNVGGTEYNIGNRFRYYGDLYKSELALSHIDANYIGPTISAFTGSYATDLGISTSPVYDYPGYLFESAEVAPRGFYSGSWNETTGKFKDEGEYILINKGIGTNFGELGDYLGDSDVAQVRLLNKPSEMWELLGFRNPVDSGLLPAPDEEEEERGRDLDYVWDWEEYQSLHPNNPSSPRYWKNIIPENYKVYQREGLDFEIPFPGESCAIESWNNITVTLCADEDPNFSQDNYKYQLITPNGYDLPSSLSGEYQPPIWYSFAGPGTCVEYPFIQLLPGTYTINIDESNNYDGGISGDVRVTGTGIILQQWGELDWSGQASFTFEVTPFVQEYEEVYGCTDPEADNYNPAANVNDGSCEFSCGYPSHTFFDLTDLNSEYCMMDTYYSNTETCGQEDCSTFTDSECVFACNNYFTTISDPETIGSGAPYGIGTCHSSGRYECHCYIAQDCNPYMPQPGENCTPCALYGLPHIEGGFPIDQACVIPLDCPEHVEETCQCQPDEQSGTCQVGHDYWDGSYHNLSYFDECTDETEVCLNIIDNGNGSYNLKYETKVDIAGFQIDATGCMTGAEEGTHWPEEWEDLQFSEFGTDSSVLIGFDLSFNPIPAGSSGTLAILYGELTSNCILETTTFASQSAEEYDWVIEKVGFETYDFCWQNGSGKVPQCSNAAYPDCGVCECVDAVVGCKDPTAVNYNPEANVGAEGECEYG